MPCEIIRPHDGSLPSFVLPDYDDAEESFYPFKRLPEPDSVYEKLKTGLLSVTVFPIRCVSIIVSLLFFTLCAIIGTIDYDPTSMNDLSAPLSWWRHILFSIARYSGRNALINYGFYHIDIKRLSYKDMKEKFKYVPPIKIQHDSSGQEIHPKCNIIVSNHLGFADILFLLYYCNGSFLAKAAMRTVFGIGRICAAMQAIFISKFETISILLMSILRHKSTTQCLVERVKLTHDLHENRDCKGCSLCLSNMCVFPEGTTTNGNDLLMFRRGIFTAGLPVRPIIIKCKWKNCNTSWETIYFRHLTWKVMSQFVNHMEVIIGPPYIPTEAEKADSALYAFNVNILMAQMMGINNEGRRARIYLTNREVKSTCYHHWAVFGTPLDTICQWAKEKIPNDTLIPKYLEMLRNDVRYQWKGKSRDNMPIRFTRPSCANTNGANVDTYCGAEHKD